MLVILVGLVSGLISDGKHQVVKMSIYLLFYCFFEKKNIFNFTGETKSCSLNVKLLTITSANSESKQEGLVGASGADLQVKFHIALVISLLD